MGNISDLKTKKAVLYHGLHQYPEAIAMIAAEKATFSLEDRNADYFLSAVDGKYLRSENEKSCALSWIASISGSNCDDSGRKSDFFFRRPERRLFFICGGWEISQI